MKADYQPKKEARPWLPIIVFIFMLLSLIGKVVHSQEAMNKDDGSPFFEGRMETGELL
jgi:hypothetical protein